MKNKKMNMIKSTFALLVIGSIMITIAAATPAMPHNFYGPLYIDGSPAPAGTEVRAFVGETDVTTNSTTPVAHVTTVLGEYGSGLSNLEADCLTDDVLTFKINGVEANEQADCKRGTITELQLSVGDGAPVCEDLETRECPNQEGVCEGALETCTSGHWPGCDYSGIEGYEEAELTCDGLDNDCDGETDEGILQTFYEDSDSDGFGNPDAAMEACTAPEGYVEDNTDFDDSDPAAYPGAEEVCSDGSDNDGNGFTDCLDPACAEDEACVVSYCIQTSIRILDDDMNEAAEINPGEMYNIEMTNFNDCEYDMKPLQIVQVSRDSVVENIGTLKATIPGYTENIVTIGFVMPSDVGPETQFDVEALNWNHWISQDPEGWEALSNPVFGSFSSPSA